MIHAGAHISFIQDVSIYKTLSNSEGNSNDELHVKSDSNINRIKRRKKRKEKRKIKTMLNNRIFLRTLMKTSLNLFSHCRLEVDRVRVRVGRSGVQSLLNFASNTSITAAFPIESAVKRYWMNVEQFEELEARSRHRNTYVRYISLSPSIYFSDFFSFRRCTCCSVLAFFMLWLRCEWRRVYFRLHQGLTST